MKIKDRLAIYFTITSASTLLAVLFAVYLIFLKFLESDFFDRLNDRTMVTAKLYLEADEISRDALNQVRSTYLVKLNSEVIRIYNANNTAVFIGDDQQFWSKQIIQKVRKKGRLQFKDGDRQVVGIFYKDNQGDFVILASAIDQGTNYRLDKLRKIMIIIFVIIFISLLLFGRWIANRMLKPLSVFINEVTKIKSSNLDFRVKESSSKDEINLLARNFNNLMAHLENAFVLQKTFISNASHELRTPVTRMMIGAEISLSKERNAEDYKTALTEVLDEAEKMNKIISGLVELAQSDLELGSSQIELVDVSTLLSALQKEYNNKQNSGKLILDIQEPGQEDKDSFVIQANPTLLLIAINNIISNAFKFSNQQDVFCMLSTDADQLIINISDNGPGIEAGIQQEIFKPFYSSADQETHKGSGMGLYMSYKIINLFKGSLKVDSTVEKGSTFTILIPF
ncbi:MAG: sensor histidine kinase [Pedobacter sp.]|nr:MAG: sensor histidine kinase [Pedobacter sp.]